MRLIKIRLIRMRLINNIIISLVTMALHIFSVISRSQDLPSRDSLQQLFIFILI